MALSVQRADHLGVWRPVLTDRGSFLQPQGHRHRRLTGSGIVAAADGEVVVSTYSYSAGNYVMINHGGGVYTVYMHASSCWHLWAIR